MSRMSSSALGNDFSDGKESGPMLLLVGWSFFPKREFPRWFCCCCCRRRRGISGPNGWNSDAWVIIDAPRRPV